MKNSKLYNVLDLGDWWTVETDGLPVPLGINVASRKSLTQEQIRQFDNPFKNSILYGLKNIDAAVDFAMRYSRGQPKDVMTKFIKMYVNDITIDMGVEGRKINQENVCNGKGETNTINSPGEFRLTVRTSTY